MDNSFKTHLTGFANEGYTSNWDTNNPDLTTTVDSTTSMTSAANPDMRTNDQSDQLGSGTPFFPIPTTDTLFQDSELTESLDFEDNWPQSQPRTEALTNTEFHEGDLHDDREFTSNWDEPNRDEPTNHPNDVFQEDELDDNREILGNWHQMHMPSVNKYKGNHEDSEGDESSDNNDSGDDDSGDDDFGGYGSGDDESADDDFGDDESADDDFGDDDSGDDDFEANNYRSPSQPAFADDEQSSGGSSGGFVVQEDVPLGQFENMRFGSEDLNDELGDFSLNTPATTETREEGRTGQHRLPPRSSAPHSSLPSLPHGDRNMNKGSAVTKEDLAMFAQLISDQRAEAEQAQNAQAQLIQSLQAQSARQPSAYHGPGVATVPKSNKTVRRDQQKVQLQKLVRLHAIEIMQRVPPPNQTPTPITSASKDEIQRFIRNPANPALGPQPHPNRLVLDFNERAGSASIWNKKATMIFTESFIKKYVQYGAREASAAFKTHIFQLKNQYKDYQKFVADLHRMGDQMDILSSRDSDVHVSRMSRRRRVLQRRVKGCHAHLDEPDINKVKGLWDTMPVEAISGDETDHRNGQTRYRITTLPWRAAWVHRWMLVFDRLHLSKRFTSAGRATPGAFPHIRISCQRPHEDRECTTVPVGLPRNFYCTEWLSKQTPMFIDSLNMQEPIDESFSRKVIRTALTCSNVVSHETPPRPLTEIPENVTMDMIEIGWAEDDLEDVEMNGIVPDGPESLSQDPADDMYL